MYYLKLDNVSFGYGQEMIIDKLDLDIDNPKNIAIIGPSGSGKTTLLKLLCGDHFSKSTIVVKATVLNLENFRILKRIINIVFDDDIFIKDTVFEELKNPFNNMLLRPSDAQLRLEEIIKYFKIEDLLERKIDDLSIEKKMLIKILAVLITMPEIIGFDDVVGYLDSQDKERLFKYLKKKNINFIMVTSDIEETLLADYLVCLYKGKVAMEGNTLDVLREEKLIRRLGFNLPFYIDLSIQLGYYELLSEIYLNKEDMVNAIWK